MTRIHRGRSKKIGENELIRARFGNETFKTGKNFDFNACVGNNGFIDLYTYQCGYYEATSELIKSIKKSPANIDLLIYPIVYSARHTIELFLKNQLFKLKYINSKVKGRKVESKIKRIHFINELWEEYKNLTTVDKRYEPHINDLAEYIFDFIDVDNTGETFRYPYDHDNTRHLSDLTCINIEIFESRFKKLYELIDDIGHLTDFLIDEYEEGTVIKGLSRQQIKEIALKLPEKKEWENIEFITKKKEILNEYDISSNTFSKVLSFIQTHKEFSSHIGLEIPLSEITPDELKEYITLYYKYHQDVKKGDHIETKNDYTNIICKKLTPRTIQSLSALFDIGYFHLYPEAYERILKEKADKDVYDIVFDELLDRWIILEKIKKALTVLGQKTLLEAIEQGKSG